MRAPSRGRYASARWRIEKCAAHRIVAADVALADEDLEQVGVAVFGTEHFRARPQIRAPLASKALIETLGVKRVDVIPMAVEAFGPGVERKRVVPAQVLDVDHLQAALLHRLDHLRETGDPASGEDVAADVE